MNKHILIILFALSFSLCTHAQVPQGMNYQAVLRDANGEVMANQQAYLRFTIKRSYYDIAYQGEYNQTTNEFGLVNITVGVSEDELNPAYGTYAEIDWVTYNNWYMQVEIWNNGAWLDMGSQSILTVPYAVHSKTSSYATDMYLQDLNGIDFENLADGMTLVYDGGNENWVLQPLPSVADGVWSSDATNAWRIGGNIGLGISTPAASGLHLHNKNGIRQTTTFTGSTWLDGFYIGQDANNNNALISNFENGPIIFQTNFGERMRIGADGNIGIGTGTPLSSLHLANTIALGEVHSKWTVSTTGHTATDGAHVGVNSTGQMVIDQKENQDILIKRNGITKATISGSGTTINGTLTADALSAPSVNTTNVYATDVTTFDIQALGMAGTGTRPVYVNNSGNLYAAPASDATKYWSVPGMGFHTFDTGSFIVLGNTNNSTTQALGAMACVAETGIAYCAVNLPHNATITSFTAQFYDNLNDSDNNGGLEIYLYRCIAGNGANEFMATIDSDQAEYIDYSVVHPVIDNEEYNYLLVLEKYGPDYHDNENYLYLWFNSVTIGYTLP